MRAIVESIIAILVGMTFFGTSWIAYRVLAIPQGYRMYSRFGSIGLALFTVGAFVYMRISFVRLGMLVALVFSVVGLFRLKVGG
jgi:hypothetical protein